MEAKLAPLSNLKIALLPRPAGRQAGARSTARRTRLADETGRAVGVRFTAVPQEVAPVLQRLVPTAGV
ncbi:MAG TPA: hypothetical protein DFS52_18075 [Myxococcales bacterium]|nr:hypothetical protein [Myxococcales bacterium]